MADNMSLSENEQLHHLLGEGKQILITFPPQDNGEAVGSALALKNFLEKQYKQVDVVSNNFVAPKNLHFLNGIEQIKPAVTHLQKFIIKVDISKAKIDTISYDIKDNILSVNLTPRQGMINKDDLRTAQSAFKYDLIITIAASDLESLGSVFLNNTDLFYRTPIINIGSHPANENYGQVNLVDITAVGTGEVIYKLLKQEKNGVINPEIATALLTSLIISTKSFKAANVSPHTLNYASQLMTLGGDREKIIRSLYHTRSLAVLKLWGAALSRLKHYSNIKLALTAIMRDDFIKYGATEDDIKDLGEELISTAPEAELIMVLYENPDDSKIIKGTLIAEKNRDAKILLASLNPQGDKHKALVKWKDQTLSQAEEEIIKILRDPAINPCLLQA